MNIDHEVKRLQRRLLEISAWRDQKIQPIERVLFKAPDLAEPVTLTTGEDWPARATPIHMSFSAAVPSDWVGKPLLIRLDVGGEGLLTVNGHALGGLDPFHKEHLLFEAAPADEKLSFAIEAVPHGPFGTPIREPRLEIAELVVPEQEVRGILAALSTILDAVSHTDVDIAVLLIDALNLTLADLNFPRGPSDPYLARMMKSPGMAEIVEQEWEAWNFDGVPLPLPDSIRTRLPIIQDQLQARLAAIRDRYPAVGRVRVCGHAHIDLAWLWPLSETRRKARRSFTTVLSLMEQEDEFVFSQSMAQLYAFVETDDPDLFNRIRSRVNDGRWEPLGGMWVEPDGNLLSGESWVRQLLYGQNYFQRHFNRRSRIAWLPDTFGFAANLPQLFKEAGMDFFWTTKLTWNETNQFPYNLYWWEGIDGSRVLAQLIESPDGYNSLLSAEDLRSTWKNYTGKQHHPEALLPFGYGDGGGGPTLAMLNRYQQFKDFPGLPKLEMSTAENYFQAIETDQLPYWVGEQYLELHRGTYTTQGKVKALNRRLEHALPEAEIASSLAWLEGAEYPSELLENCWQTLLRNQFHDILPGSGVRTVVEEAEREMGAALAEARGLLEKSLNIISQDIDSFPETISRAVIWNLSLQDRPLQASFPRPDLTAFRLLTPTEDEIPYQISGDQVLAAHETIIPGLGYLSLSIVEGQPSLIQDLSIADGVMENRYLRVAIHEDGTIHSIYDKENQREILADSGNQIWSYPDYPREWEAWDVDATYQLGGEQVKASKPVEICDRGPVRVGFCIERQIGTSHMKQWYWLWAGSRRLEIETWIDWDERVTFLRALFPLAIRAHEAWYETAFGAVPRPTHRNTSWDQARFEVPALRFVALCEASYGVSLINDSKYGHSADGKVLGISLMRGPIYPDPFADRGEHTFRYAIYPHRGDWREDTVAQAHDFNAPLCTVLVPGGGGGRPASDRFIRMDQPALQLAAMKRAEDGGGLVMRMYEAHGGRGRATLDLSPLEVSDAWATNILEENKTRLPLEDGRLVLEYTPFQIRSLRLRNRKA